MRAKKRRNPESDLQISLVDFFDRSGPTADQAYLFSIPNGGRRDEQTGAILKAEGARAGMSDLVLLIRGGRAVFLETKLDEVKIGDTVLQKKTRQSTGQRQSQATVEALGFTYRVVRSLDDFLAVLDEFEVPLRARPALSFRSR